MKSPFLTLFIPSSPSRLFHDIIIDAKLHFFVCGEASCFAIGINGHILGYNNWQEKQREKRCNMNQSGLKSYRLGLEEIENLLQSQYGSSIQPINYEKLRQLRVQQARSAAFATIFKREKASTDTLELENIALEELE
jgi:catechol-2,3-dioxygenase